MRKACLLALLILSGCSYFQSGVKDSWTVGILVYDGVYNTEFVAPMDVFEHAGARGTRVEVFLVAPAFKAIESAEGLKFRPHYSFADHPKIDVLVIPGFRDYETDLGSKRRVLNWIQSTAEEAQYVLSNRWGAFLLARTGLLDGREAMTFPPDIEKLQEQFPKLRAVPGMAFVRDGKFITGGGGVSSYDNALYVVQELWGEETARNIATGLVRDWDLKMVPHRIARKSRDF